MSRTVASVLRSRSFGATGLQALMRRFFHYRLAYTFHAHAAATATTLRLLTSSWRSLWFVEPSPSFFDSRGYTLYPLYVHTCIISEGRGRKSGGQQPYWTSTRAVHNSSLTGSLLLRFLLSYYFAGVGTRDELRASFAYVEKRAVDFKMKVDEVKAEIKELEDGRDWKSLTTAEKNRLSCLMDKLIVLLDEEKLLLEKRSLLRKQLAGCE